VKSRFWKELHTKNVRRSNLPNRDVIKNRRLREEDFEDAPSRSKVRPQPRESKNHVYWDSMRPVRKQKRCPFGALWKLIASFRNESWDQSYSTLCKMFPRRTFGRANLEEILASAIELHNTEWTHREYGLREGVLLSREEYSKGRWAKSQTMVKVGKKYYGYPDWGWSGRENWYELVLITLNRDSEWDMYWQKDYFLGHYYDADKALAFYGDANLCCNKLYQVHDRRILRKIAEVSDKY